jgi:energy-coupling factor transporter ATP-binding protein EcfA2
MAAPALAPEVTATLPPFPYPGLRPFEPEEWSIFFGREMMIDNLVERLAQQGFVLIHGASGSGKSSLVRAGVLPKLARQHLRHGAPWLTCAMRPSGGPLWNLAAEFARLEGRGGDVARISDIIRQFNRRDAKLSQVVASLDGLAGKRVCLLVDQFEEIFRFERETSREETELFIELLIAEIPDEREKIEQDIPGSTLVPESIERSSNLHIVITMRSEFLGECARFDHFAEAINRVQYLVPRLTRAGLMRAIRHPAQLYGGEVTTDLADRLIADVRGKLDELPLIQHGLMLFWHERVLTQQIGKVILDSAMLERAGSLAQLLSDHADRVRDKAAADAPRRTMIERLFRSLTDTNAEGQAIRRPQFFRDLVAVCSGPGLGSGGRHRFDRLMFWKKRVDVQVSLPERLLGIIDEFRADGVSFLTPYAPSPIGDNTMIDISHESLIRSWQAIADPQRGWLRHEFEDGLVWRLLLLEAREFEQNKKRVLSPATTRERTRWLLRQTSAWSERYGGNWNGVNHLLKASRRAGIRSRRFPRLFFLILICYMLIGLMATLDTYGIVSIKEGSFGFWLVIMPAGLICLWIGALIVLIVFDTGRDWLGKLTGLVRAASAAGKRKNSDGVGRAS